MEISEGMEDLSQMSSKLAIIPTHSVRPYQVVTFCSFFEEATRKGLGSHAHGWNFGCPSPQGATGPDQLGPGSEIDSETGCQV